MKRSIKKSLCTLLAFLLLVGFQVSQPEQAETVSASTNTSKIHFLTLTDNTDAILLECNGKFGMVDSGEDSDYPSGKDSRYPDRPGIVQGKGFESKVISYMKSVGVTKNNFEFYIGTHPHSDHIGSADEIIYAFHPKRVYIEAYSDNDITESTHLWDNLYVYDHMVTAAKETGATLIQTFDKNAPLYPETVTVRGTIVWNDNTTQEPDPNPDDSTTPEDNEEIPDTDPDGDSTSDTDNNTDGTGSPDAGTDTSDNSSSGIENNDTDVPDTGSNDIDDSNHDTSEGINTGSSMENAPAVYSKTPDEAVNNNSEIPDTDINDDTTDTVSDSSTDNDTDASDEEIADNEEISENDNAAVVPENSLQSQSDTLSADPPSGIKVTLTYSTEDSDTSLPKSVSVNAVSSGNGIWTYEFTKIRKYDDTKTPFTYEITPSAEGFTFTLAQEENPYDFICSSVSENRSVSGSADVSADVLQVFNNLTEDSGTSDEPLVSEEELAPSEEVSSDNLTTGNIPSSDQMDASHPDDPTNAHEGLYAAPAQSGVYDGNKVGVTSTPVFTLGGKNGVEIEIMNYGVTRPQPDANYFSLGVKVTDLSTRKTAFLSGDINNYIGAETALASKLGHVDILKLGHHGSYGSNTYGYLSKLNPQIAIMTGNYSYVSNSSKNGEIGTLDSLIKMSQKGMKLYATAQYAPYIKAIVVSLDSSLSTNIPKNKYFIAAAKGSAPYRSVYYYNGKPTKTSGWKKNGDGTKYYFENSYYASTSKWLKNSNGQWLYLKDDGAMAVGWVNVKGKWYYMNSSGVMTTGWQKVSGKWYYMDTKGVMLTGRQKIGDSYYYLDSKTGAMASDAFVNGYYYNSSGKWVPNYVDGNWKKDSKGWWYQLSNGKYPKSCWMEIHSKWYYFNSSGYMATGWKKLNNSWYYLGSDGARCTGWQKVGSSWYYFDSKGKMKTGWLTISGKKYYLASNGAMKTGWQTISKKRYYFDGSGVMRTGWFKIGSNWYYFNSEGTVKTGWLTTGGKKYYLASSGVMKTGWQKISKNWYYFDSSGVMKTGWYKVGNKWYYSNKSGKMQTGWLTVGKKKYYLSKNGVMQTGWLKLSNKWYYMNSSGVMTKGWQKINNKWYYMNKSTGVMYKSAWTPDGCYVDKNGVWTGKKRK